MKSYTNIASLFTATVITTMTIPCISSISHSPCGGFRKLSPLSLSIVRLHSSYFQKLLCIHDRFLSFQEEALLLMHQTYTSLHSLIRPFLTKGLVSLWDFCPSETHKMRKIISRTFYQIILDMKILKIPALLTSSTLVAQKKKLSLALMCFPRRRFGLHPWTCSAQLTETSPLGSLADTDTVTLRQSQCGLQPLLEKRRQGTQMEASPWISLALRKWILCFTRENFQLPRQYQVLWTESERDKRNFRF